MKSTYLGVLSLALVASTASGCAVSTDSSDPPTDTVSEALTTNGLTAAVTQMSVSGSTYTATVTVSNNSKEPVNNWQIGMNFNSGSFITGQMSGVGVTFVGDVPFFTAPYYASTINAGSSYTFTFNGNKTGTSYTPTVRTVDGVAPGTVNAGNPADGIDTISRAAATAAINIGYEYETHKKGIVNGDPNYHIDSGLIWDSHAYRVASGNQTIEFDPNVPGYAYIPNQAMAELAFAQLDPTVASYLTTGLADCFGQVNSYNVYAFKTGLLAISFPGGGSGFFTSAGDNWTTTTASVNGTMEIRSTLTSNSDPWFGILTYANMSQFAAVNSAVNAKYNPNGQNASCSPFNGPGGANNPYLVMSLGNGSWVPARYLAGGTNCTGGCTATAILDPVPYAEPGAYYDANNNLVGPQPNPFGAVNTNLYADPAHQGQWASRTVNNTQEWGTFTQATVLYGQTKYMYVKQM